MRVPRALEFPAVILVTGVLTFTGVSALQASVNAPLAKMAQKRIAKTAVDTFSSETNPAPQDGTDFRAVLSGATPPDLLVSVPAPAVTSAAAELAITGAATAAAPEGVVTAVQPPAQAHGNAPVVVPVQPAQAHGNAPIVVPVQPAQAHGNTPIVVPVQPAPAHGNAPIVVRVQPATVAPQPSAPVTPAPKPSPVSGMDYVWDQTFGNGSYGKPGVPPKSHGGNGKTGVGQVCPPGQAKKKNC